VGGLLAPLVAPLAFFCVMMVLSVVRDGAALGLHNWQAGILFVTVFILPVSYVAMWVVGIPYIYWLRSICHLSILNVSMGALVFGVIAAWIFQWIGKANPLDMVALGHGALFGAPLSLSVALAFCWIVGVPVSKNAE
jgi:hypothetical protein